VSSGLGGYDIPLVSTDEAALAVLHPLLGWVQDRCEEPEESPVSETVRAQGLWLVRLRRGGHLVFEEGMIWYDNFKGS